MSAGKCPGMLASAAKLLTVRGRAWLQCLNRVAAREVAASKCTEHASCTAWQDSTPKQAGDASLHKQAHFVTTKHTKQKMCGKSNKTVIASKRHASFTFASSAEAFRSSGRMDAADGSGCPFAECTCCLSPSLSLSSPCSRNSLHTAPRTMMCMIVLLQIRCSNTLGSSGVLQAPPCRQIEYQPGQLVNPLEP